MFENLQVFRMAHAMAKHAGARQSMIAQNMAHADTPDYRAMDIAPFEVELSGARSDFGLRATRAGHLNATPAGQDYTLTARANAVADPNGNSVSLETEMLYAVDTKRQHDRAVAIYKSSLSILSTAIGRR